jgi:hypothetical protein
MTPSSSSISSQPFAAPQAGVDYFASEAHCRSLARRVIAALGGFSVVVVTEDPPASSRPLSMAVSEAAAPRHLAIPLLYSPKPGRHDLLDFRRALLESLENGRDTGEEAGYATSAPLIILDNGDRLSDEQIEEVFKQTYDQRIGAALVLASSEFLARLERPVLRFWLAKRLLVARLRFQELGPDEVPAFIRRQLRSSDGDGPFTDEAITAIANVSGGDPMVVNRFSRRLLDFPAASAGNVLAKANLDSATANLDSATVMSPDGSLNKWDLGTATERLRQNFPAPRPDAQLATRMSRNRAAGLMLCTGIALCLACVGLIVTAEFIHPNAENVTVFGAAAATDIPAKLGKHTSPSLAAPDPTITSAAEKPEAVGAHATPTTTTAPDEQTPEAALTQKAPALPLTVAVVGSTAELVPKPVQTEPGAAIPPGAPPTEVAAMAAAASPPATQATEPTPGREPVSAKLRLPPEEVIALLARGDSFLARKDISSARLLYERAADAGDGRAALKLGRTFDPAFLYFSQVAVRGDRAVAEFWYRRARELGEPGVEIRQGRDHP